MVCCHYLPFKIIYNQMKLSDSGTYFSNLVLSIQNLTVLLKLGKPGL